MILDDLEKYNYVLPDDLIRKEPLNIRHNAKLFIYNIKEDKIIFDIFLNLYKYLPENSNMFLNETKVLPCRLIAINQNQKEVEIFLLLNEWDNKGDIPIITNTKIKDKKDFTLKENKNIKLEVCRKNEKLYLKNNFDLDFVLDKYGITPIPHYLEDEKNKLDQKYLKERYNTIFASSGASVAAPTASLHFTEEVFENLKKKNIKINFLRLDVGRGTFANLKEENFKNNKLHTERYFISAECKKAILEDKIKIVVGTTSCRTLESYALSNKEIGETDIFITPSFQFKNTDILITNFHLPKTSLMLLVQAFLEYKNSKKDILELYQIAIQNKFSFYSFGDSMLLI